MQTTTSSNWSTSKSSYESLDQSIQSIYPSQTGQFQDNSIIKVKQDLPKPTTQSNILEPSRARFPLCVVWTPLPLITWVLPFIGHTGICTTSGIIHDFAGSCYVGVDDMAFGEPHKYVILDPSEEEMASWDKAIEKGDKKYNREDHNLCCNNCHSHCAYVLNMMNYKGRTNYTMIDIWWMVSTKSKYVSWGHLFKTYLGGIVLLWVVLVIIYSQSK